MLEVLIAELQSIDDQAFEMAVAIVQHPASRSKPADKAKLLKKKAT